MDTAVTFESVMVISPPSPYLPPPIAAPPAAEFATTPEPVILISPASPLYPAPIPAPLAAPAEPSVSVSSMTDPVTLARVSRNILLKNMLALPALITPTFIPISSIMSIPYLKEKTIPSWTALATCFHVWTLKLTAWRENPDSLLPSILSAPLPKGRTRTPPEPTGTSSAATFISSYMIPRGAILFLNQALAIPVPLMQRRIPRRGSDASWLTWAKELTLDSGS